MTTQELLRTTLSDNQFINQSYEHYGGAAGFDDFGILGTTVKNRFVDLWRSTFITNNTDNDIVEIETPTLVPHDILKASGHVDRFADYVVTDSKGNSERADHLVKAHLEANMKSTNGVDGWTSTQLETYINENNLMLENVRVESRNLMFGVTNSGTNGVTNNGTNGVDSTANPEQHSDYYLRPELAQNIFVNFKRVYDYMKQKLPFGIAQVGKSYRREISPKPFVRMREFLQMEIEYAFDPMDIDNYIGYTNEISSSVLPLYSEARQIANSDIETQTVEYFITNSTIENKIMATFLVKIYNFAMMIGLKPDKVRFREHMKQEKAHYAKSCWDLECLVDNNWLECVGCANRQDYDLKAHSHTHSFAIKRTTSTTKSIIKPNYKEIWRVFKDTDKEKISQILKVIATDEFKQSYDPKNEHVDIILHDENKGDIKMTLTRNMIGLDNVTVYDEFFPHIIEPSFGINRLIYAVFEQNFWTRENDSQRVVFSLNSCLAPYNVAILRLSSKPEFDEFANKIRHTLQTNGIRTYIDLSNVAIGRQYARADKIGIKYAITIDFDSFNDNQVTIRERDTMLQKRVEVKDLVQVIKETYL